jgi:serine/threonine protein kinase
MPAPATVEDLLGLVRKSAVVTPERLEEFLRSRRERWQRLNNPGQAAAVLLKDGLLSQFQTRNLLEGRSKGFWIKRYLVLEDLGAGGMGRVFLCEQTPMNRLVAVKVLPANTAPGALERFLREARASAALDHPNIVRAFDVDHEDRFHFLVMEFVDGPTLERVVEKSGALDVGRACNYAIQAADGLHHAHLAGWIHRDVKPGNLLVDRAGTVKVLDLGLARFALGVDEQLTKRFDDQHLLGTADYIAPEQTLPNHPVDSRADIYSLGATLYFLLAGRPPYVEGNVLQKLMCHQLSDPPPLVELRAEVPRELAAIIERMMAKSPDKRLQTAEAVAAALQPFAKSGPFPPSAAEMTEHCTRVRQLAQMAAMKSGPPPRATRSTAAATNNAAVTKARVESAVTDAKAKPATRHRTAHSRKRPVILIASLAGAAVVLGVGICGGGWWAFSALRGGTTPPAGPGKPPVTAQREYVTPAEAAQKIDQVCTVQFQVKRLGFSKNQKTMFLNSEANYKSDTNFTVVVHGVDGDAPGRAAEMHATYEGKTIRVSGPVALYDNRAQIVLNDLSLLQVVASPN